MFMKKLFTGLVLTVILLAGAGTGYTENLAVQLTQPANKAQFDNCSDILLTADASVENSEIDRVTFYQNGSVVKAVRTSPYETVWANVPNGIYMISAVARDDEGNEVTSASRMITVGETEEGNLVINGDFNCRFWPWRLDQYEGAVASLEFDPEAWLTDDSSGALIDITNVGNFYWGVQLMQPFVLLSGHTYEVSFVAEAAEPKDIQVTFSMDYDPYDTHWYEDITVYDHEIYGPFTYECDIDDPKVMFKFVVGGNLIPMVLDAVQVIDLMWTDVEKNRLLNTFKLAQNYPNPFNPSTEIRFSLEKPGHVQIQVYDALGRLVRNLVNTTKREGRHTATWDGLNQQGMPAPSGVYFCQLAVDQNAAVTKKLVLSR